MEPVLVVAGLAIVLLVIVAFVTVTRRRGRRPAAAPEAPPREAPEVAGGPPGAAPAEVAETPTVEAPPAPTEAPPAEAPPRLPPGARLFRGLVKSRNLLAERLSSVIRRGRLDEEAFEEIEEALIRADLGVRATTRILERLRERRPGPAEIGPVLREEILAALGDRDRTLHTREGGPSVWLVTGVNGVGKTTTIAKLAARLRGEGRSVVLAAADTFRAAAIDQLGTWAERVGVHMVRHAPGADPGAVVFDAIQYAKARDVDVVIVDTAGRLHTKTNLMEELKKVRRVAEREPGSVTEVLLVLDATVGQNGIAQARTFQEAIDVTGLVLTKLDGTAKGGIVVAVQEDLGIPVKAVGLGESLEDLVTFDPEAFVDALLEGDAAAA